MIRALCLSLLSSLAFAAPPKLAALTKVYADKHGLPVRVVQRDLGTRQIERHFVPVLPATHDDFLATFQSGKGAILWRTNNDKVHGELTIQPGYSISYFKRKSADVMPHAIGGQYLTLALTPEQVAHYEQFLDKHIAATQGQTPWNGGPSFQKENGGTLHGGCMWWFVHAHIAPNLNLATAMGVRRAKGPEVLAPRLIHAGNELVGPIGIPVATIEEFKKLTDDQLLGPEPAGGAAEQVKQ